MRIGDNSLAKPKRRQKRFVDNMKSALSHDGPLALVTGAAGFIGSHLVNRLLDEGFCVIGLDNFIRGRRRNLSRALERNNFILLDLDCSNATALFEGIKDFVSTREVDTFWHLAANSDVNAGVSNPNIDLRHTFMTTFAVLETMKKFGMKKLAFTSSSAIYGQHSGPLSEDDGPLLPVSFYGAMKLASEAAISAAVESFLEQAWIFRFPNVVGPRATHGVIFDLLQKLKQQPSTFGSAGGWVSMQTLPPRQRHNRCNVVHKAESQQPKELLQYRTGRRRRHSALHRRGGRSH